MNLEASGATSQPIPEQMDEEFTKIVYPSVQENLKLTTEGGERLEEPAYSAEILSSLQQIDKELSFADQFLEEKPQDDEPEKPEANETEAQSMVTVPIHQDTSSAPLMTTPVIDLTTSQPASTTIQASVTSATPFETTTTTTVPPPTPQSQQGSPNELLIKRMGELEGHIANMIDTNQALETRLDKYGDRLYKLEHMNIEEKVDKVVDEIASEAVE